MEEVSRVLALLSAHTWQWPVSIKSRLQHIEAFHGKIIKRGRSVGYIECELIDETGKLIAKASSTCMVLRGETAKGR